MTDTNDSRIPQHLWDALTASYARRAAAQAELEAANSDVARKRSLAWQYEQDVVSADEAISFNDNVEAAERLADALRVAEARSKAAANMARKSADALALTQTQLAVASRSVETAADAVLEAEGAVLVEEFLAEYQALLRLAKRIQGHVPHALHIPVNAPDRIPRTREILDRLLAVDPLHTRTNIGFLVSTMSEYDARRAELIAGELQAAQAA